MAEESNLKDIIWVEGASSNHWDELLKVTESCLYVDMWEGSMKETPVIGPAVISVSEQAIAKRERYGASTISAQRLNSAKKYLSLDDYSMFQRRIHLSQFLNLGFVRPWLRDSKPTPNPNSWEPGDTEFVLQVLKNKDR